MYIYTDKCIHNVVDMHLAKSHGVVGFKASPAMRPQLIGALESPFGNTHSVKIYQAAIMRRGH